MRLYITHEFTKFVIVGVLNTGIYYALYLVGLFLMQMPYMLSHIVAVVLSMIFSFFLNSYFTYKVKPSWRKFFLFPLTQLVNIVVTMLMLLLLVEVFHVTSSIAPIVALFVTVPITFVVTGRVLKAA